MNRVHWHHFWHVSILSFCFLAFVGCSDYRQARSAYEAGDYVKAFQIFERLSKAGDSQAQYDLSQMYLQGIGTSKNLEQGWNWMNQAAEKGNVQAMIELALRYQKSPQLETSAAMTFKWFEKAAYAGSAAGQYNLAHLYLEGNDMAIDYQQAYVWMMLASDSGYPIAASEAKTIAQKLSVQQLDSCNRQIEVLKKQMP